MKALVHALAAAALTFAAGALAQQSPSNRPGAENPAAQKPPGADVAPSGRAKGDTNKMGVAGPESAADSDAPNKAACKTIKVREEREKCLEKARQRPDPKATQ